MNCPICNASATERFFTAPAVPVFIGVQWHTESEARKAPSGDLDLAFCNACGFIWNQAFDPEKLHYSEQYDNALDYSKVFQDYASGVVTRLVDTYSIKDKEVVEIGCGKGRFLAMLCEAGNNRGVGYDPSYEGERWPTPAASRIEYVRDLYSEKHASGTADLVCCRFVFEHIQNPLEFLKLVRRAIGDSTETVVYFEVPNVRLILEDFSPWDIIYEHCSYFGAESLACVFKAAGFDVLRLKEAYGGQFLGIDARPSTGGNDAASQEGDLERLQQSVVRFRETVGRFFEQWKSRVDGWHTAGKRVVAWGAGAKAVGFVNLLHIGREVEVVVDINPHKQGLYLAGSGQRIVAPGFLAEHKPDVVILMNPIYREEIASQLAELGCTPELVDAF